MPLEYSDGIWILCFTKIESVYFCPLKFHTSSRSDIVTLKPFAKVWKLFIKLYCQTARGFFIVYFSEKEDLDSFNVDGDENICSLKNIIQWWKSFSMLPQTRSLVHILSSLPLSLTNVLQEDG